jgi:hypothetical protein
VIAFLRTLQIFHLLTGTAPFQPKHTVPKTIAHMSGVPEAGDEEIPEAWLADRKMKDYATAAAGPWTSSVVVSA